MGKPASELVGSDILVTEDGEVIGTLHKVEGYDQFSNNAKEKSGYFFPFHLGGPAGTTMKFYKNDKFKKEAEYDADVIIRVANPDVRFRIEVDDRPVIELSFEDATFEDFDPVTDEEVKTVIDSAAGALGEYITCSVDKKKVILTVQSGKEDTEINMELGAQLASALSGTLALAKEVLSYVYVKGHDDHPVRLDDTGINLLDLKAFLEATEIGNPENFGALKGKSFDVVLVDANEVEHGYNISFAS